MASVTLMSPSAIKEETVVSPRTSMRPKRKCVVLGVAGKAGFMKTRPKVAQSTIKNSKESVPLPPENSFNVEKVIDPSLSTAESQTILQPVIDQNSVRGNYQEFSSISSPKASEITPKEEIPDPSTSVNTLNPSRKRTIKKGHERRKGVLKLSSAIRSEMSMGDLIYWKPASAPMKEIEIVAPAEEDMLPVDDPQPSTEELEDCNVAPKVKMNDEGNIILDESSLFVCRKDTVDHSVAPVVENDNTTYSSFKSRPCKPWSKREIAKFYKALGLVGADFALMESIFKEDGKYTRTRRELKHKFLREEKSNPKRVHEAMYNFTC